MGSRAPPALIAAAPGVSMATFKTGTGSTSGFSAIDPLGIECDATSPSIQIVQFFPIRLGLGSVVPVANVACTKKDRF